MRALLAKLSSNQKVANCVKNVIIPLLFLYMFIVPALSGRYPYNYVAYFVFGLLLVLTIVYKYLYCIFSFDFDFFLMIIFSLCALVSTIFGSKSFGQWLTLFFMGVTFFTVSQVYQLIANKRKILYIFVFAMLAFSVYFIYIYKDSLLDISNFSNFRLGDYFDNVNQIGFYFCLSSISSFYLFLFKKNRLDYVFLPVTLLFAFLSFTTGSRTTLICLFIGLVLLIVFRFKERKLTLLISLLSFIVILIIVFALPFMETLRNRFFDFFQTVSGVGYEASTFQRGLWQQYGFYMGLKNIFIGNGAGGFSILSGVGTYTHADFSEIFCNFGLLGFVSYFSIYVYIIHAALKYKQKEFCFCIAVIFIYIALGFLGVKFSNKITSFFLPILIFFAKPNKLSERFEVYI